MLDLDTLNLIKIYLTSTLFAFKGTCYKQTESTTMGSPLSPIVTKFFMGHFEYLDIDNFHLKPRYWFQFFDDVFVVWLHDHPSLTHLFNHLNNISPHIHFNMNPKGKLSALLRHSHFLSILWCPSPPSLQENDWHRKIPSCRFSISPNPKICHYKIFGYSSLLNICSLISP